MCKQASAKAQNVSAFLKKGGLLIERNVTVGNLQIHFGTPWAKEFVTAA